MRVVFLALATWLCSASAMMPPDEFFDKPDVQDRFKWYTKQEIADYLDYLKGLSKSELVKLRKEFDDFLKTNDMDDLLSDIQKDKLLYDILIVVYAKNKDVIKDCNSLFKQGKITYNCAPNPFIVESNKQFTKTRNGNNESTPQDIQKPSKDWGDESEKEPEAEDDDPMISAPGPGEEDSPFITKAPAKDKDGLPSSFDWRERGAVTPVKNQKTCGACYAFAAVGALETQWYLYNKRKLVTLSEQHIVDCSKKNGCGSGSVDLAYRYIRRNGIDSLSRYPYIAKNGTCKYRKPAAAYLSHYVRIPKGNEARIKWAVYNIGPVAAAMDGSQRLFQFYTEGVYDDPQCQKSRDKLDHGVVIVGWGTEKNGQEFWWCKNSWGKRWGLDGYFKLARNNNNQCGIATSAGYPLTRWKRKG